MTGIKKNHFVLGLKNLEQGFQNEPAPGADHRLCVHVLQAFA